jgi:outer membrane protein OmpA-like peptidoglycan-associated protein
VRDYLVSKGVPQKTIEAQGVGPDRPVADNKSAEGRANNRRVEIVVRPAE